MKKVIKTCIAAMLFLSAILLIIPARTQASDQNKKEWNVYRKTEKIEKKAEKAKETYRRLLNELLLKPGEDSGPSGDIYFLCDDMNGDGVPELLLQYGLPSDEECRQRIYVYRNRRAKCIYKSTDGRRMVRYYPQSRFLMETGDRTGWTLIRYYKMAGKTMTLYAQAQEPDGYMASSYGGRYNIKNKNVSKRRFNKYIRKATRRKSGKKIEPIPNTEENIYLKL